MNFNEQIDSYNQLKNSLLCSSFLKALCKNRTRYHKLFTVEYLCLGCAKKNIFFF